MKIKRYYTDWDKAVHDSSEFYKRVHVYSLKVGKGDMFDIFDPSKIIEERELTALHVCYVKPITRFELMDIDK